VIPTSAAWTGTVETTTGSPIISARGQPARLTENPEFAQVGDEHAIDPAGIETGEMSVVGLVNVYDSRYALPEG